MKKLLIILAFSLLPAFTSAQIMVPQGGTGRVTFTQNQLLYGIGTGRVQSVATTSATCAGLVTCTSFNVLGSSPVTLTGISSFAWPWVKQADGSQGTSTQLSLFGGFLSTASSSVSGVFRLPLLSNGGLGVFGGHVISGATTTAGTGLTYSGNAFNVNSTQSISKLSNLTSNGFVKTSGGDGTLTVDTASYLSSIGSGTNGQLAYFGGTNTLVGTGTSSASCSGTVSCSGFTVVGSVSPTITGSMSFAYPFFTSGTIQATSTVLGFYNGFVSSASSTLSNVASILVNGSTTLQNFTSQNSTQASTTVSGAFLAGNATTTNLNISTNHLTIGSNFLNATVTPSFSIASTTLDAMGNSFSTGTTTLQLANFPEARTLRSYYCVASSTGSVVVQFGDGTNWTTADSCSTTGKQTITSTNNTFTALESFQVRIGSSVTSPSRVTLTPVMNKTSD